MSPLEIALIIIGIIVIIVSCRVVEKTGKTAYQAVSQPFSFENNITEEDKKKLIQKIDELLSDVSEETVIRTDDTLSKLSNEKIMSVNEFSDQILEKIKRNHEEVVFLYNMLNDKEKELKAAVREIDSSKKKVQDMIETKASAEKSQAVKNAKPQIPEKLATQTVGMEKTVKSSPARKDSLQEIPVIENLNTNNNAQILTFYSQGKSVMEISKLLGLGQGEVKLVIDLYKGKK